MNLVSLGFTKGFYKPRVDKKHLREQQGDRPERLYRREVASKCCAGSEQARQAAGLTGIFSVQAFTWSSGPASEQRTATGSC